MPNRSKQSIAADFENEVREFMGKIQFSDREGSDSFRVGDKQVDAAGGLDNIYVIVDCVTTIEKVESNSIRSKIEKWRGNYSIFKEGMKNRENLKKYNDIRLVIAIRNFKPKESDIELARKNPTVYLWDSQFFDYYTNLYDKIGIYSQYELKRELEIPITNTITNIPALKIGEENGAGFYMGIANPLDLLKVSYVARRERGDQRYYQRMILSEKLEKLAYYIHKDKKKFYNNIILAANDGQALKYEPMSNLGRFEFGSLNIGGQGASLWIIDGQHRLYGFAHALKRFAKVAVGEIPKISQDWIIPFSVISSIDELKQGQLFMDINTTQTSLNPNYIWDLRSIYGTENQKFISNIVKELNRIGCMKEMVYIPTTSVTRKKGAVSISKIARGLEESKKILGGYLEAGVRNPLLFKNDGILNPSPPAEFLEQMMRIVKDNNEAYFNFYLNGAGIQVFVQLISDFLYYGKNTTNCAEYVKYLMKVMDKMHEFSTQTEIKTTLGNLGSRYSKAEFVDKCKKEINMELDLNSRNELPRLPTSSKETIFAQAERTLRGFIYKILSRADSKWYKTRLPGGAWDRLRPMKDENPERTWERADMSLCTQVLTMTNNWDAYFKDILIKPDMYQSKDDLMSHLTIIKNSRDPKQHLRHQDRNVESAAVGLAETLIKRLDPRKT
jgi:DGQHR domain-containing protein